MEHWHRCGRIWKRGAMNIIRLPAVLDHVLGLVEMNRVLRNRAARLDWSGVHTAPRRALEKLLAGLDLSRDADFLGLDTVPDTLSDAVADACTGEDQHSTAAVSTTNAGAAPEVWRPGPEPE